MATKSILKTIHIKNQKSTINLVRALENANGKIGKNVSMSRPVTTASNEEIRKMFGEQNDRI